MPSKVWNEMIYPFPNLNGSTAEVIPSYTLQWMWLIIHAGIKVKVC